MAITRHATGNSRPRQFEVVATSTPSTTGPKKPRAKKTATGRVGKKSAAGTPKTTTTTGTTVGAKRGRKPTLGDKVKGAAKKAVGKVEGKPGKKAAGTSEMRGHDGKKKVKKV